MPRQTRTSRAVAILATGVVAMAPLLAAGPAEGASPRIEFSGSGAGLLSCNSRPSDDDLTVPAESTVLFVNGLGERATLRIDGRSAARVDQDESKEVLFYHGTVRVDMVPDCGLALSSDVEAVSVTVAAPAAAPGAPSSGSTRPAKPAPAGASDGRSGPGAHRPGAGRSTSPDTSDSVAPSGAPAGGVGMSPESGAGDGSGGGDDEAVAAEPVSTEASSKNNGPNGLLTIIAVICLVGVSAGAIRAIAAQRATRTSAA